MDLICENYFKKKHERRIESFEKETLLGIFEIIDKMHKHSIEDYKHVIDGYLTEEDDEQIKSDIEFEKIYSEQFNLMFEHIAEEFQYRLKILKSELIKKLDIKKIKISDNKSDNESDNESTTKKLYKYFGPYVEKSKLDEINQSITPTPEMEENIKRALNIFKNKNI